MDWQQVDRILDPLRRLNFSARRVQQINTPWLIKSPHPEEQNAGNVRKLGAWISREKLMPRNLLKASPYSIPFLISLAYLEEPIKGATWDFTAKTNVKIIPVYY